MFAASFISSSQKYRRKIGHLAGIVPELLSKSSGRIIDHEPHFAALNRLKTPHNPLFVPLSSASLPVRLFLGIAMIARALTPKNHSKDYHVTGLDARAFAPHGGSLLTLLAPCVPAPILW
jgi:hypothetical protein